MTNRTTGWIARKDHYAVPVLFNPYTGEPRDVRDVQSDPQGILIVPPGNVDVLAAPTTQPAPQQEAQEPVAVVVPCHTPSGKRVALYSAKQDLPVGTQLYTAPQSGFFIWRTR